MPHRNGGRQFSFQSRQPGEFFIGKKEVADPKGSQPPCCGFQADISPEGTLSIRQEGKSPKFVSDEDLMQVTFSARYAVESGQRVEYITERAVFRLTPQGIMLTEIAPGVDLQRDILDQMGLRPLISPQLKEMDRRLFLPQIMGLKTALNSN